MPDLTLNFNFFQILFFVFFLVLFSSCGVKGYPYTPKDTNIVPWYLEFTKEPDLVSKKNTLDQLYEKNKSLRKSFIVTSENIEQARLKSATKELKDLCQSGLNLRKTQLLSESSLVKAYKEFMDIWKNITIQDNQINSEGIKKKNFVL